MATRGKDGGPQFWVGPPARPPAWLNRDLKEKATAVHTEKFTLTLLEVIRLARWGGGTGLGKEGLGEKLIGQSWCQKPEALVTSLVTSDALRFHGSPSTYRERPKDRQRYSQGHKSAPNRAAVW